jgi:hypothetical protein
METTLKRTLTRKSILGFGYKEIRDLSIQMLLDLRKHRMLIDAYFNLQKIDFVDDVLNEIGITEQYRIPKPGRSENMRKKFYTDLIAKERQQEKTDLDRIKEANSVMKDKRKAYIRKEMEVKYTSNKGYLKGKNQGKFRSI